MFKSFSMELAGRTLTVEVGRVAKQANGAAFMHYGDTVVLSTATASDKDSQRERERRPRMQPLPPVLSTVRCVRYSRRTTETT